MASNNYYNQNHYRDQSPYGQYEDPSYHGASGRRQDAPLPPVPGTSDYPSEAHQSPFNTPFDDDQRPYNSYNPSTQSLNKQYSYADSGQHDPFEDRNAIPLQTHPGKSPYGQTYGDAPSPTAAMANAERFGGSPGKSQEDQQTRRRDKWLKNIPYAVYTLTLVQIIVFLVEIIKNGM